jgi:diguanylate cyclase (GGDEF)-like protein
MVHTGPHTDSARLPGPDRSRVAAVRSETGVDAGARNVADHAGRGAVVKPMAWKVVLAIGFAVVAAYFLVPTEAGKDLTYSAIGIASTAAVLIATRIRRPAERWGWYLLAAASACFVVGDGVLNLYDMILHTVPPFPSVADALYLAGYPFLFAGVFRVSHLRGTPGSRESRADAAMISVGALALSWQFLMGSYAEDTTVSSFAKLVTMAYPVMDIGVLFIVVAAVMNGAARRPTNQLIALAVFMMLIGDFAYNVLVLHSSYTVGNPVDAGFLLNYVFLAAAAAHPSVANPSPELTDAPTTRRRLWLPLVAAAGFVSPVIVLVSAVAGWQVDAGVLAATSIVLFTLAVLRASWLFGRLRSQTSQLRQHGESLHAALVRQQGLEDDLRHQAFHDSLTGLPNRALLHERVEHALQSSARVSGTVALCFCDLDGFKGVNDSLGHRVGDTLLGIVGKRLTSIVRSGDTVARLGGDEFAILLENVEDVDAVTALADRIVSVLHQNAVIDDQEIYLSASVGVAFAGPGTTTETLLSEADAAMYVAKANGKDRFTFFEPAMRSRIIDRVRLMNSFQGSLHRSEFFLEYQPQHRLSDGRLEGFEALVRWQHPILGLVGPYRFIPLAEETGFIVPLGRWVLEQACIEAANWTSVAGEPLSVSVNLSGRQLQEPGLAQDVQTALSFSGLPPQRLVLEITESVLMLNRNDIAEVLKVFKKMGIRIAIDDFGTGYSSLGYLRQFPVDILKIDKSFVDPLADPSSEGTAFVQTILRLAKDLNLDATAEGIEHQIQRDTLTRLNCHSAQGYLMSRPLSRDATRDYIAAATATRSAGSRT